MSFWLFVIPWITAHQASLSFTIYLSLLKLMSIELVMPSNHLSLCRPLLLLLSTFSCLRVFSNESVRCTKWPKYCSFSFSISPSNDNSGLISFWIDWLDLIAVKWTLQSLYLIIAHYFLEQNTASLLYYDLSVNCLSILDCKWTEASSLFTHIFITVFCMEYNLPSSPSFSLSYSILREDSHLFTSANTTEKIHWN